MISITIKNRTTIFVHIFVRLVLTDLFFKPCISDYTHEQIRNDQWIELIMKMIFEDEATEGLLPLKTGSKIIYYRVM